MPLVFNGETRLDDTAPASSARPSAECSDATERLIVLGNILLLSFPFHFFLFSLEWPIWQHSHIAFLMWTGLGYEADKGLKVKEGW